MKLTVVIVNYNVRHYLEQCLRSLELALKDLEAEVYVVDNHSKDGSVEILQPLFPWVHFISSIHNLGFARANNIAIQQSKSEYVLLLNPDTVVAEPAIAKCVKFMDEHPDAGALGVMMHMSNGKPAMESRRGVPTPLVAFYKMTGLCRRFPKSRVFGKYYMSYLPWDKPVEIEVVSGAFCFLRREAIDKVGILDEDFFMYGEDIDLSYRLLKGGYHNWYVPEHILHYKGESTQKSSFRYVHVFYEAMLIFFRKHYSHLSFLITLPIKLAIFGKAFLALIYMMINKVSRSLGFIDKQTNRPVYLFVGGRKMIEDCQAIVQKNALTADYYEADFQSHPQGHSDLGVKIQKDVINYVVYDTDSYSYEAILNIFEKNTDERVQVGFYHPESSTIITDREVIG